MSQFKIIFSQNSLTDIENASAYYNEQKKGLGKRFAKSVQSTLKSINSNPYYAAIRYDDIRCAGIKTFPFMIHYHVNEQKKIVSILSVYNTYREPLG